MKITNFHLNLFVLLPQKFFKMRIGILLFLLSPYLVFSQSSSSKTLTTSQLLGALNPITTAVPFLIIGPDSKQGGMGEVGAATDPDVNSIHWNGAKLAMVEKDMGFGISYSPWLRTLVPDISLSYVSGYKRINKMSVAGMSLRYFSLGNITFTDIMGNTTGQFKPNEFAIDLAYAQKLSPQFSMGMAFRYVNSNLTGGYSVNGQPTKVGQTVAVDISMYYRSKKFDLGEKKNIATAGLSISNLGAKIDYGTGTKNFIPTNLRLGGSLKTILDDFNTIGFYLDFNKLLVPTPPVYLKKADGMGDSLDPATGKKIILAGKDPNVPVIQGVLQSFGDAPGGFQEELREINTSTGFEYWYSNMFAFRMGYFYEHKTKGGRQFLTFGFGIRYSVFGLDASYLVPTVANRNHPLQNTWRFTLSFDFDAFKKQNENSNTNNNP
ncbi:MAG: type IX secretion system outer membrane channel protein PorV [Bacteroidia bacterium]|nr:type IX secretion system outer membrane channel protein PorV [Bacteroidia bacterium]